MRYNKKVADCFFSPRHVGVVDLNCPFTAHVRRQQMNPSVLLDLYLECSEEKWVKKARFKARGNPFLIAALEWLCRELEGKELTDSPIWTHEILVAQLGIPVSDYPLAIQVEEAYKEILKTIKTQI